MSRRRGSHAPGGHDGPDERWMASYMDMVTVLMCLFIVLYAISTVDQNKYEQLASSLARGFGLEVEADIGDGSGVEPTAGAVTAVTASTPYDAALQEVDDLVELRDRMRAKLEEAGVADAVGFVIDGRGLIVRLVGTETFFDTNQATLTARARAVLDAISEPLASSGHEVAVEGHADRRPPVAPFPTNWELSTARSTEVLRHLVGRGIPPSLISAVGYGDARPLAEGSGAGDLAQNRRTDIVVLSDLPDEVRALFERALVDIESGGGT